MIIHTKNMLSFSQSSLFVLFLLKSILNSTSVEHPSVSGEYIAETGFYQSIDVKNGLPIFKKRSEYQDIIIYNSEHYGKILVLDGVVQLTEKDSNAYNEMIAHAAMFSHPKPKRVLVIGGGDGYVLHEVLKHPTVVQVDHVDLDEDVINACSENFAWGKAWEDSRVNLNIADGAAFVRDAPSNYYDVIIQDSSDPFAPGENGILINLPSEVLYKKQHFENIHRILSKDGVFNFQAETFNIPSDLKGIRQWRKQAIDVGFADSKYGSLYISSYPTGQIGFLLCRKMPLSSPSLDETKSLYARMTKNGGKTSYYQPKLQISSFDLPLWVEESIYSQDQSTVYGKYNSKNMTDEF
mmetsp:Transcript_7612/g.10904  ORF Transcript_7612/g.10904 Transcript_7612/m.10904 type:complete len:352 (+) Transcript_7612:37-1092(+)